MTDYPTPATSTTGSNQTNPTADISPDSSSGVPAEAGTAPAALTPTPLARPAFGDPKPTSPASPTEPGTADPGQQELQGRVERLREIIASLRGELDSARQAHRDDIAAIGRALLREAEDRDWCQDYDQVIDELNQQLTIPLPERERAWDVSFDVRVTVHLSHARNADAARELAADLASDIETALQRLPHVTAGDAEHADDFTVDEAA